MWLYMLFGEEDNAEETELKYCKYWPHVHQVSSSLTLNGLAGCVNKLVDGQNNHVKLMCLHCDPHHLSKSLLSQTPFSQPQITWYIQLRVLYLMVFNETFHRADSDSGSSLVLSLFNSPSWWSDSFIKSRQICRMGRAKMMMMRYLSQQGVWWRQLGLLLAIIRRASKQSTLLYFYCH